MRGYCDIKLAQQLADMNSHIATRRELAQMVWAFYRDMGYNSATLYDFSCRVQRQNNLTK